MTPRRQQTSIAPTQPVRFYKFIALTFLLLTFVLLGLVIFMSSKRANIVIETKSSPISVDAVVEVDEAGGKNVVKGKVETLTIELGEEFQPTGTKQEEGVATGIATLYNDTNISQPLVATTRLLTPEEVLFRIKDGVTVPANGSVDVEIYADKQGESGNISPSSFTIPGLREDKQKVIYAKSSEETSGGLRTIGVLSTDDYRKAEKNLLESFVAKAKAQVEQSNEGQNFVTKVIQHTAESDVEIGEEVSGFTLSGQATVLVVYYDDQSLKDFALEELTRRAVDDTEIIEGGDGELAVTIDDYDLKKKQANLRVVYDGVAYLNSDSKQLEKNIFYGKSKDEVRRYILKLDHVKGVDIKFSPAWIKTVPRVSDHVEVIIKSVE